MIKERYKEFILKLKQDSSFKAILGNISWLFFDKAIRIGLGFILTALIARHLGSEIFGVWNYAIAFVALFSAFSTLGMDNIVVREIVKDESKKNDILGAAFLMKVIGGLFAILLSLVTLSLIRPDNGSLALIVALIAFGFIFQAFDVIDYYNQSKLESKHTVVARNVAFIFSAMVKVVLLLKESSLIYFVAVNLTEIALTSMLLICIYNKKNSSVLRWAVNWATIKKLFKDSFPLLFAGMVILIYMRIDQIMLGNMVGDSEVGIFSAAVRLSEAWYFIPLIITNSLLPSIISVKDTNPKEYTQRVQKSLDLMAALGVVTAILVSVFAYHIIEFIYGTGYSGAAPILAIHTWTSIFVFIGFASSNWFIVENLQKYAFYRTLAGAVINLFLNYYLIPLYGGVGAAIATLVSQFIASYFFNLFSKKTFPVFKMQTTALLRVLLCYKLINFVKKNNSTV